VRYESSTLQHKSTWKNPFTYWSSRFPTVDHLGWKSYTEALPASISIQMKKNSLMCVKKPHSNQVCEWMGMEIRAL